MKKVYKEFLKKYEPILEQLNLEYQNLLQLQQKNILFKNILETLVNYYDRRQELFLETIKLEILLIIISLAIGVCGASIIYFVFPFVFGNIIYGVEFLKKINELKETKLEYKKYKSENPDFKYLDVSKTKALDVIFSLEKKIEVTDKFIASKESSEKQEIQNIIDSIKKMEICQSDIINELNENVIFKSFKENFEKNNNKYLNFAIRGNMHNAKLIEREWKKYINEPPEMTHFDNTYVGNSIKLEKKL